MLAGQGFDRGYEGDGGDPGCSSLPLGVLHLGVKTAALERAGWTMVNDLADVSPEEIVRLPAVGRRTADLLFRNRDALVAAGYGDGPVDWDLYCKAAELPLLPCSSRPETGEAFLAALPGFLEELMAKLPDETSARILQDRICQPPESQKTLEEIGEVASPPVTRERVRQKEAKLLRQLAGGLLNDSYDGLDIHFRPEFAKWWRFAADRLAQADDIGCDEFIETLAVVWNVPRSGIVSQLPAIVAIVTGEAIVPQGFRSAFRIDPALLGEIGRSLRELPLRKLRVGRDVSKFEAIGIEAVGDVIACLRSGHLRDVGPVIAARMAEHLNLLAGCFDGEGSVDWHAYRARLDLDCIPETAPEDADAFVSSLPSTTARLLEACQVTSRASEIYRFRTSRPAGMRPTLQATAEALESHGPSIKREETVFLSCLHEALIDRDFSALPVWVKTEWLAYWEEADGVYQQCEGDFDGFVRTLAWRWRLTSTDLKVASPTLWAVLSGYPDGRRRKRAMSAAPVVPVEAMVPAGRIRLRGFRRLH